MDRHGPNSYKPNVRKALKNAVETGTTDDLPEDPWRPADWTELNVRAMFEVHRVARPEATGAPIAAKNPYGPLQKRAKRLIDHKNA